MLKIALFKKFSVILLSYVSSPYVLGAGLCCIVNDLGISYLLRGMLALYIINQLRSVVVLV